MRVVQWSTGNVGRHALAGIDARPDLELAGVWVSSEAISGLAQVSTEKYATLPSDCALRGWSSPVEPMATARPSVNALSWW